MCVIFISLEGNDNLTSPHNSLSKTSSHVTLYPKHILTSEQTSPTTA